MNCAVLFGGTGFIGSFFANYLLANKLSDKVYLVDIESPSKKCRFRQAILNRPGIEYIYGDVRQSLDAFRPGDEVILTANFAAVHREPGHQLHEYFETNLLGAENVCEWAEKVQCNRMIFTSSISPYGPSNEVKSEESLPLPITAYGCSKLVAEKIHLKWQSKDILNRKLVIARPGVVFGPGEGGNVTRLIKAVTRRYFFYMDNQKTRKAGIYVKELSHAMWWLCERLEITGEKSSLANITMNPSPSVKEYVDSICSAASIKRHVINVPYHLLLPLSYLIDMILRPFGLKYPVNPVRLKKLVNSNNIIPGFLVTNGYQFCYSLDEAMKDWKESCPEDWC